MQFACVVYAGIFQHQKIIPKYEKLMMVLFVCTRHIPPYTTNAVYHWHIPSYDSICEYMPGYHVVRISDGGAETLRRRRDAAWAKGAAAPQ